MRASGIITTVAGSRRSRLFGRRRPGSRSPPQRALRHRGRPGRQHLCRRPAQSQRAPDRRRLGHRSPPSPATASAGFAGDGGPAARAGLVEPNGLAFDPAQQLLFIADVADNRVRVVDLAAGTIATFAGTGEAEHTGDGGPAQRGRHVRRPRGQGRAPTARSTSSSARAAACARSTRGPVSSRRWPAPARAAIGGDGGPALAAVFDAPKEMAIDPDGDILIVDTENHAIRRFDVAGRHRRDHRRRPQGQRRRWRPGAPSRAWPPARRRRRPRRRDLYRRHRTTTASES